MAHICLDGVTGLHRKLQKKNMQSMSNTGTVCLIENGRLKKRPFGHDGESQEIQLYANAQKSSYTASFRQVQLKMASENTTNSIEQKIQRKTAINRSALFALDKLT